MSSRRTRVPFSYGASNRCQVSPITSGTSSARIYKIQTSTTLQALSWITLTGITEADDGDECIVMDWNASIVSKFYRLGTSKS